MKYKSRLKPDYSIMMTPMIDVVFLLLIFFMVTYTQADKNAVNISLPRSATSESVDVKKIMTVALMRDGRIIVENKTLTKDELVSAIKNYVSKNGNNRIILKGDKSVAYGRFMDIMDIARQAGIKRVSLATRYKERTVR
jgi:biopolymer transport protein ExbD